METIETMEEPKKKYELEDLLCMLGGDQYYSMNQIYFVYHKLNGDDEEAEYYNRLIQDDNRVTEGRLAKMRQRALQARVVQLEDGDSGECMQADN